MVDGSPDASSRQLLCIVFAGDARLAERLRSPALLPLGSRIRRRLPLDYASRDELCACLDHLLQAAGNPNLMTLAEHSAGLMNLADEFQPPCAVNRFTALTTLCVPQSS